MSSDELQSDALGMNGNHYVAAPDVTIKFFRSDFELQGHKSALVAGSTFFSEHFQRHPSSARFQAPKDIRPRVTISVQTVEAAIDYLHGNDIPEKDIVRNSIPLLLAAKAFGISSLEERVRKHLTEKLDHQVGLIASEVQIIGLVDALRELYGRLGGKGDIEVGKEVAGIVTGAAAYACCRRFPVLKKSPEFMALMKEVPVLAYDILASDVEMVAVVKDGESFVEGEDNVESGESLNEVVEEIVTEEIVTEEVVTKVVEEVTNEVVEEVTNEVVEEVTNEVVEEVTTEVVEEVVEEAVDPMEE